MVGYGEKVSQTREIRVGKYGRYSGKGAQAPISLPGLQSKRPWHWNGLQNAAGYKPVMVALIELIRRNEYYREYYRERSSSIGDQRLDLKGLQA
jgi:hypothetical protein